MHLIPAPKLAPKQANKDKPFRRHHIPKERRKESRHHNSNRVITTRIASLATRHQRRLPRSAPPAGSQCPLASTAPARPHAMLNTPPRRCAVLARHTGARTVLTRVHTHTRKFARRWKPSRERERERVERERERERERETQKERPLALEPVPRKYS
jgi:hypothetical protein